MDIYIVRKCKVEKKEFKGTNGAKYEVPVMTEDAVFSYVFKQMLTEFQKQKIQKDLESFYTKGGTHEKIK